jgi:SAM-dependent methyltransferase
LFKINHTLYYTLPRLINLNTNLNNLIISKISYNVKKKVENPFSFASTGLACHAIIVINKTNIFNIIKEKGFIKKSEINKIPIIISAINILEITNVLSEKNDSYILTNLGKNILDQIGLFIILFEGYAKLLVKYTTTYKNPTSDILQLINGEALAIGSEHFGKKAVDPVLIPLLKKLKIQKRICDLGCGSGYRLHKIYNALKLPGLGIDLNKDAIRLCEKRLEKNPSLPLLFHQANVTQLDQKWEDVEIVMQHFMTHDIHPKKNVIKMLKSFSYHFPNLKYCIVVDIVLKGPNHDLSFPMPGFEYVHGLQNFIVNNYDEIISIFKNADFEIIQEIPLNLPCTYLWLLKLKQM